MAQQQSPASTQVGDIFAWKEMKGIIKNQLREWQIMSLYCNCLIKSEIKQFNPLLLNNLNPQGDTHE